MTDNKISKQIDLLKVQASQTFAEALAELPEPSRKRAWEDAESMASILKADIKQSQELLLPESQPLN